jgi:hypothetical protein
VRHVPSLGACPGGDIHAARFLWPWVAGDLRRRGLLDDDGDGDAGTKRVGKEGVSLEKGDFMGR